MYAEFFEFAGYRVLVASTPEDTIQLALTRAPSAIVINHRMAGDGTKICALLKAEPSTRRVPVVLLTSPPFRMKHCCDAVLCRPVLPDELESTVHRLIAGAAESKR